MTNVDCRWPWSNIGTCHLSEKLIKIDFQIIMIPRVTARVRNSSVIIPRAGAR